MKKQKKKIPFVANMSCEGQVQCPLCYGLFTMPDGQDYRAGIMECPWCHKKIDIGRDTAEMGNAIIAGRAISTKTLDHVSIIKRVQWHLDVPVCSILAGIKAHVAAISINERFWLFYHLGCETAEDLVRIIWELIRLRRKHKRSLNAA